MPDDRDAMLRAIAEAQQHRFHGKYRATVQDNRDPAGRARLRVEIPEVFGSATSVWALPCVPYAGPGVGLFALPPVGASVWVEFEAGSLRYPIWAGCFWADGDLPAADAQPEIAFLRTDAGTLRLDARRAEIVVEANGARITLSAGEIRIEAPTITNDAAGGRTTLSPAGFDAQQGAFRVI